MSSLTFPDPDRAVMARVNDIVKQLRRLVPEAVMISDREGRSTFESDALTAYRCLPLAVVLPTTTQIRWSAEWMSPTKASPVPMPTRAESGPSI